MQLPPAPLTLPQEPQGLDRLSLLTQFPAQRPLDPNGIDVPAELERMKSAYALTHGGKGFGGRSEAGYSIFPSNTTSGVGHTGFTFAPENKLRIPTRKDTLAVVHTHGQGESPLPSAQDLNSSVPNYVFSGDQLYSTNPKTHKYVNYDINKWNGLQSLP